MRSVYHINPARWLTVYDNSQHNVAGQSPVSPRETIKIGNLRPLATTLALCQG